MMMPLVNSMRVCALGGRGVGHSVTGMIDAAAACARLETATSPSFFSRPFHCGNVPVIQTEVSFAAIREVKVVYAVCFVFKEEFIAVLVGHRHLQCCLRYVGAAMRYAMPGGILYCYVNDYCGNYPVL